jgi:hypothetical protein
LVVTNHFLVTVSSRSSLLDAIGPGPPRFAHRKKRTGAGSKEKWWKSGALAPRHLIVRFCHSEWASAREESALSFARKLFHSQRPAPPKIISTFSSSSGVPFFLRHSSGIDQLREFKS